MDVNSNYIANSNTTAFKSSRVDFADSFRQMLRGSSASNGTTSSTPAMQIGTGVITSAIKNQCTQGPIIRSVIEENADMLNDLASSVLASKSIPDLEKPEARNLIRSELMSQFNESLGKNLIQDVYITKMAIQ